MWSTKEKAKKSKKSGITLIAVIITVIVLLILAGVSYSSIVGKNGVIDRAEDAGVKTSVASFLDEANVAFVKIAEEKEDSNLNSSDVTLQEVVAMLTDPNGDYKEKILLSGVEGITTNPTEVSVILGETEGGSFKTKSAKAQVIPSGEGLRYFAEINGSYYEMKKDNNKIVVGEKTDSLPDDIGTWTLSCTSNNANTTAEADTNSMKVTASSNTIGSNDDITITYSNGSSSCETHLKVNVEHILGKAIHFTDGEKIAVAKGHIDDNWKLFNYDDKNVYLIYGDLYPIYEGDNFNTSKMIQTEESGISLMDLATYNLYLGYWNMKPRPDYNKGIPKTRSVTGDDRNAMISYLKNYSGYDYNNYTASGNYDSVTSNSYENSYKSWKDLWDGLRNTGHLGKKVNGVQGAPNITMWCDSWNKKGYGNLTLKNHNNKGYYCEYKGSEEKYAQNLSSDAGYSDTLFFPYNNANNGGVNGGSYWFASPCGNNTTDLVNAYFSGWVYGYFSSAYLTARPVVSISKSDFLRFNVDGIKADDLPNLKGL